MSERVLQLAAQIEQISASDRYAWQGLTVTRGNILLHLTFRQKRWELWVYFKPSVVKVADLNDGSFFQRNKPLCIDTGTDECVDRLLLIFEEQWDRAKVIQRFEALELNW